MGKADDRRRQIVSTAAQLFEVESYTTTSMEAIAKAVGLAKPSLYHYFASKDEILYAIHDEFISLLLDRARQRVQLRLSAEQQLLEVFGDVFELMETHRGHVRVFFEHHRELPQAQQAVIRVRRDEYESLVEATIISAREAGAFRQVDPRLATLALFGMVNWAYQWYRPGGPLTARQIAVQFWDLFVNGAAVRASSVPVASTPSPDQSVGTGIRG